MKYLLKLFRICSECSVNIQNVQQCSDSVQSMFRKFRIWSEFTVKFRMFRLYSECSVMFRICSEYLAQQLVCSEFLDFAVYFEIRCFQSGSMNECSQSLPITVWSNTHSNILRNLEFGVCFQ